MERDDMFYQLFLLFFFFSLFFLYRYGWIQNIYRNTARELKRFDSTTQSPIFNHFGETLAGLTTIRAFRCETRMMNATTNKINYNTRFWTKSNFANRWLGLRLDWIGAGLVGFTAFACVIAIRVGIATAGINGARDFFFFFFFFPFIHTDQIFSDVLILLSLC